MSTFLQNTGNQTTSDTANVGITGTFGSNTTSGSTILVVAIINSSVAPLTISDSEGNTYTVLANGVNPGTGTSQIYFWYAKNIKGGTANVVTVQETSSAHAIAFSASEYSGLGKFIPFQEMSATATGTSGAPTSAATTITSYPNQLIIGVTASPISVAHTVGAGFGNFFTQTNATVTCAIEDKSVTSIGTQTSAFVGASTNWWAGVYTFVDGSNGINRPVVSRLRPHPFSPGLAR